ncbi:MAG: TolC family outer membrane protein [Burkholderiales bacterium]
MKKSLKINILMGAVALTTSAWVNAETLKEVVQLAVETNPQVGTVAKRKEAADAAVSAAKGAYFPKIDFLYGSGSERSQTPSTLAVRPDFVRLHRHQEGATLNQMIFDGMGTPAEVDRRRAISDAAAHRVYATAEEIALQAIDAYIDVLKNKDLVSYAKENLSAHQRTFDQVKLRSDKGVGRRADLEQIEARTSLASANVTAAESSLRDAEIAFLKVVGRNPINLVAAPDPKNIPTTADAAVKTGFANHPTLKSSQSDIEQATAQRELARSFWFPRLEFEASYTNNRNLDGVVGPNRDRLLMLYLKWNLFRGGFDYHRMKETALQIDEATEISRNTNRQVENAVRLAYNAYATARDRIPSLDRYVKSSNATRAAYAQQFAIGQRTLLDLLDAENEYFTARSTEATGKYIQLSAKYRVLNAMGQLLSTLEVKAPEQSALRER